MFFACGLSAYSAAMFHLGTHAFFKALLFLGAGSVIHSLSGEQDIRRMGGIWKKIPFTYVSMIMGSLALVGIFPFAGYFSKDLIMDIAYVKNSDLGYYAYSCGLITILCTSVYSVRLLYFVFHGSKMSTKVAKDDSMSIRTALFILSVGAIFSGVLAVYLLNINGDDLAFWNNSIETKANIQALGAVYDLLPVIKFLPMIVSISGALITFVFLRFARKFIDPFKKQYSGVYVIVANKFYFDEIYDFVFVQNFKNISEYLSNIIETKVIDNKGPNGASSLVKTLSGYISKIQTGFLYNYIAIMLLFIILILAICLFKEIM
jgi:NADH-quinone oxidoreductase subunit L